MKGKNRTKILDIKKHFINCWHELLNIDCGDVELIVLIEEGVELCDKVLDGTINVKHFNDHIKLTRLGLDLYVWVQAMRAKNLIAEE